MMTSEQLKVGKQVKCLWTMRTSKAYRKYGTPARNGDAGEIFAVHNLKDVMIVQFRTADHRQVCCHVQSLAAL